MTVGLTILVVDDSEDFAASLADILELDGHSVEVAHCGEEALEKTKILAYDLTFMDVKMPGMDGLQRFTRIRQMRPEAQVVMITAYGLGRELEKARSAGAWGVLQKPTDLDELLEVVSRVQRNRG